MSSHWTGPNRMPKAKLVDQAALLAELDLDQKSWYRNSLFREARAEVALAKAAEADKLPNRMQGHLENALEIQRRDRAIRKFEEFPARFMDLQRGIPCPDPVQVRDCERRGSCLRVWLPDGVPLVTVFGRALVATPGWAHLRQVPLDSDYPAKGRDAASLYVAINLLKRVVSEDQIMVLVDNHHVRPRENDPYLVVQVGSGYYLIYRW